MVKPAADVTVAEVPKLKIVHGLGRRSLSFVQAIGFFTAIVLADGLLAGGLAIALHVNPSSDSLSVAVRAAFEAAQWVSAILASILAVWLFKVKVTEAGYAQVNVGRGLALGGVMGLGLLSAIIAVLYACGQVKFAKPTFDGVSLVWFGVLFILVALTEEGVMRGPLLSLLSRSIGFWPAAILTSLLFLALHMANSGETALGLANVGLVGLALAWLRQRTGALWLAIAFHAAWDFAQSYLFGVADSGLVMRGALTNAVISGPDWLSGGSVGPEGGLLCTAAICLLVALVHWLWPQREAHSD